MIAFALLLLAAGSIHADVPAPIDPKARYLFYLHGAIVEVQGRNAVSPDFGRYEYDAILDALAGRGFVVIGEVRSAGAGLDYAKKVAAQVRRLIAAGVPPGRITVVGASKGGYLAQLASAELGEDGVNFVVISGCNPGSLALAARLRGRFLSVYDEVDRFNPSCREALAAAARLREKKEVVLKLALGHGLLYKPRKEWLDLVAGWAGASD